MTLTINRSEWLTGDALREMQGDSCLLHERTSLKCCLGFYLESIGVTGHALVGKGMPSSLELEGGELPEQAAWLMETHAEGTPEAGFLHVEDVIACANDNAKLTAEQREERVAAYFRRYGDIDVEFVGDYTAALATAAHFAREEGYYAAYEEPATV